jgi:hypothetical protein
MSAGAARLVLATALLAGCSYVGHRGAPTAQASATSTASLPPPTDRLPSGHPATAPASEPPASWSTQSWDAPVGAEPPALFPLADGDCGNLEAWSLADGPVVTYGDRYDSSGTGHVHLARVQNAGIDPSGAFDLGFEPPAGDAGVSPGGSVLAVGGDGASGTWVLSEYAGRTISRVSLRVRRNDAWETLLAPNMARHQASAYGRDGVAFLESGSGGGASSVRVVRAAGVEQKLPDLFLPSADFVRLRGWPGGLAALSRSALGTALRIFDGSALRTVRLPPGEDLYGIFALGPDAIFASSRAGLWRVVGDALVLTKLAADPQSPVEDVVRSPAGDVWAIRTDGIRIQRRDGTVESRPLAEPFTQTKGMLALLGGKAETREEPSHVVAGVDSDDPWMAGESGKLYRLVDGAWKSVPLPRPPFLAGASYHASRVIVAGKGDAFVVATSSAIQPGGKAPATFHALLRTRRPAQTFRCDERTRAPEGDAAKPPRATSAHGFRSWPPVATETCATPFVVAFGPHEGDAGSDYPKLAAAVLPLAKKLTVVDFDIDGAPWVGFSVPKVSLARELATRVAQALGSRAEVVCGTPPHVLRSQSWGAK